MYEKSFYKLYLSFYKLILKYNLRKKHDFLHVHSNYDFWTTDDSLAETTITKWQKQFGKK